MTRTTDSTANAVPVRAEVGRGATVVRAGDVGLIPVVADVLAGEASDRFAVVVETVVVETVVLETAALAAVAAEAECDAGPRPGSTATTASSTAPAAIHFHRLISHLVASGRGGEVEDDDTRRPPQSF